MTRYFDDGTLPIESDPVENLILYLVARPPRMSLQANNIMSLTRPSKLHDHDAPPLSERHTGKSGDS